jgi:hypothetical protein
MGHRQRLTQLKVTGISAAETSSGKK